MTSLDVLSREIDAFSDALGGLPAGAWERPTRCSPWSVRELVAHVTTAVGRVSAALDLPPPARADTTAEGYYRADGRFSAAANADRVRTAAARIAPSASAADVLADFSAGWASVLARCRAEPADRVVLTRHGDAMLLDEFLRTRVAEVALHGLDVADAVPRSPWLTGAAAEDLIGLLFTGDPPGDRLLLLRQATGRAPADAARLDALGLRGLAFG